MMKLIFSLALAWTLSSSVGAFQCQTCNSSTCSTTQPTNCTSETMCLTASLNNIVLGDSTVINLKGCAPSSQCSASGTQMFSFSANNLNSDIRLECCNTTNCNSGNFSVPVIQSTNNLTCCLDGDCNDRLQCRGIQDRCFRVSVGIPSVSISAFGCMSESLCLNSQIPPNISMTFGNGLSCCDSSLCNGAPSIRDARSISLGLIPLLLGLFYHF